MKIKRKSIATKPIQGGISDTLNVDNKVLNAPSINLVQQMVGIPEEGVIQFDGTEDEIPEGYEKINIGYSLEETLTGKMWINGKPIYRVVVSTGNLPNNTYKEIDISNLNIDSCITMSGYYTSGTAYYPFNIPRPKEGNNFGVALFLSNRTTLTIETGHDRTSLWGYAILEYTKTTD